MTGVVLFGAGSPFCADVAESCRRADLPVVAAVRNVPGPVHVPGDICVVEAAALTPDLLALPFLLPLFGPANRRKALAAATELGFRRMAQLIDPTAIAARDLEVGDGVYVNAGCILATGIRLDRFSLCNRGANLGHGCRLGAFASIGPGAVLCGDVDVGESAQIGAGAIILPKVMIGGGVMVAGGAVVAGDVPAGGFAAGNPARILARRPEPR